jgi:hypothetical protein
MRKELGKGKSGSVYRFGFRDAGAVSITGMGNQRSPREIKYSLLRAATEERNVISSEMDGGELKSRTVSDVSIQLKVQEKVTPIKSSAGLGVALPSDPRIDRILGISTRDRVSGLNLGPGYRSRNLSTFTGLSLIGKRPSGCRIRSPWLVAERKVSAGRGSIQVEDSITNLRKYFLAKELESAEFRDLQDRLNDCFKDVYVIYRPQP